MKINTQSPKNGFAMLEVLISILVIAFGLLGLAGLQGFSIRNNHNAYLRNQATLFAYDIADRMRANRDGYVNGFYHLGTPAADTSACQFTTAPAGCTAAQLAAYDLLVWGQMVSQLPQGQGIVCIDSTPSDGAPGAPDCDRIGIQYVAKIWFNENNALTQFNVVFQP